MADITFDTLSDTTKSTLSAKTGKFDELMKKRDWASSYPINRENIENFARFAEQSGGFSRC